MMSTRYIIVVLSSRYLKHVAMIEQKSDITEHTNNFTPNKVAW